MGVGGNRGNTAVSLVGGGFSGESSRTWKEPRYKYDHLSSYPILRGGGGALSLVQNHNQFVEAKGKSLRSMYM